MGRSSVRFLVLAMGLSLHAAASGRSVPLPPESVIDFRAIQVLNRSVELSWLLPDGPPGSEPVVSYLPCYSTENPALYESPAHWFFSESVLLLSEVPESEGRPADEPRSVIFNGFPMGATLWFGIVALGHGEPDANNLRTAGPIFMADVEAPPPVDELEILEVTETSIALRWMAPGATIHMPGTGDAPAAYDLRYSDEGPVALENWLEAATAPAPVGEAGAILNATIPGLVPGTVYWISIRGGDGASPVNWSDPCLPAYVVTQGTKPVSPGPPDDGGSDSTGGCGATSSSATSAISGILMATLAFGSMRLARVGLICALLGGIATASPPPPPSVPGQFHIVALGSSSLKLFWTASRDVDPGDDYGRVESYVLYRSTEPLIWEQGPPYPEDEQSWWTTAQEWMRVIPETFDPGEQESFEVEDLQPNTYYSFAIAAVGDGHAQSAWVYADGRTAAFVDMVAPAAVGDLRVAAVRGTTVELAWTEPADNNGATITLYDLRVSNGAIDADSFIAAPQAGVDGGLYPTLPGDRRIARVSGLTPGSTYHFAIRVGDERRPEANWSAVSQSIAVTIPTEPPDDGGSASNGCGASASKAELVMLVLGVLTASACRARS